MENQCVAEDPEAQEMPWASIGNNGHEQNRWGCTLRYAIMLPGRKSDLRAGFWPYCYRENIEIGPPAGRRPAGGPISVVSR